MNKIIIVIALLFVIIGYAQEQTFDKIELRNGKIYLGKVDKIKADIVEFKESETDLSYEFAKKDIRYIQLAMGKILTFDDESPAAPQINPDNTWDRPKTVEDNGPNIPLIILATVGVVLIVLLIIGAAAQ